MGSWAYRNSLLRRWGMERFWMEGRLATDLLEVRSDIEAIDEPGFWAICGSFEEEWICARFGEVRQSNFPESRSKLEIGEWKSSKSKAEYLDYVERIRELISAGVVYQVNACRILEAEIKEGSNLEPLFNRILQYNPAPYAAYLSLPGIEIASASPERFISLEDGFLTSSPIKGTSATENFLAKDEAENLMIVDLIRNDISRVSEIGSVTTPRLLATEKHPGLFHLVSDIRGERLRDLKTSELLRRLMPPGSVSGAPKSSALKIIAQMEGKRGPYCGVLGWSNGSEIQLSVAIRTFWRTGRTLRFGTGAGITWGSEAESEWEETELKARRLISLANQ